MSNGHGKNAASVTPNMFARAVSLAARAFEDGRRPDTDELYLTHSLDVAQELGPQATTCELTTAVLHDVLEETEWTADDLAVAGINGTVLEAVKSLTRQQDEDEDDFLARICATPDAVGVVARRVKVADITVNLANATSCEEREHYERALSIALRATERYG
jgi:(p)ppGpp synthase/HD superfamily hydrolase